MGRYLKPLESLAQPNPTSSRPTPIESGCPSVWVQLAALPDPYSHDQALLLCKVSEDEWLVWIPDYGETVLHISEFYEDSAWN